MNKTVLITTVGFILGLVFAFFAFVILFAIPGRGFGLYLLGIAAVASFVLTLFAPEKWVYVAVSMALPTILMSAVMLIGLAIEGRFDWHWIRNMGLALGVTTVPSWLAYSSTRR